MKTLQALIFDVDGTLADTERDGHRVAFNLAFAAAGLDWEWSVELYKELLIVAGGKERIRYYINQYCSDFQPLEDLDQFVTHLHRQKTRYYQELIDNNSIALRPGVKRVIHEAKSEGVRLAIATTTSYSNVTALLEKSLGADAPSWFEVIAAGDMVPSKKPASDVYEYVLDNMALNPLECIAFEDSEHGFLSANNIGLKTVVNVTDYTQDQDFAGAALKLNHLGEMDNPFTVLEGNVGGNSYLDLKLARNLLSN